MWYPPERPGSAASGVLLLPSGDASSSRVKRYFLEKGSSITPKLYEGGDISAISKSLSTSIYSNSGLSRNQSAELPVKYILWWLLQHDAQAKHFQTLDTSHVPTHVLAAILEALVQHLLFLKISVFHFIQVHSTTPALFLYPSEDP